MKSCNTLIWSYKTINKFMISLARIIKLAIRLLASILMHKKWKNTDISYKRKPNKSSRPNLSLKTRKINKKRHLSLKYITKMKEKTSSMRRKFKKRTITTSYFFNQSRQIQKIENKVTYLTENPGNNH